MPWTADFKGEFRTGDGSYCYLLTIADLHARFVLDCRGRYLTKTVTAWPVFEAASREYGLPSAIRTDNGAPFVTRALCGLSHLNVWWMRLGVQHQRNHPASPREYLSRLPALKHPGHYTVMRVTPVGTFRFKTTLFFIANALRGYHIGLDEEADGVWSIFFSEIPLAKLDERNYIIRE